jgi:hypothetical protein
MLAHLAPYFSELGLPAPSFPKTTASRFDGQLAAALESGASVFSFTFGELPAAAVEAIKARNMFLIGTATTVEEALALEKSGVDAIVAQGSEAGGHRGTFLGEFVSGVVGSISLAHAVPIKRAQSTRRNVASAPSIKAFRSPLVSPASRRKASTTANNTPIAIKAATTRSVHLLKCATRPEQNVCPRARQNEESVARREAA